jgi:hypothetical protein
MNDLIVIEKIAQGGIEDARSGQRLVTDYEARVQHGPERVHGLVPADAAAGFTKAREGMAAIPGGAPSGVVLHHY